MECELATSVLSMIREIAMTLTSTKPSHEKMMILEAIQMMADYRSRDHVMILPLSYHLNSS